MAKGDHYHVWVVAWETRTAAFLSRAFGSRSAANIWASRHCGGKGDRIVWRCQFGDDCPRLLRRGGEVGDG